MAVMPIVGDRAHDRGADLIEDAMLYGSSASFTTDSSSLPPRSRKSRE